jgi:hypothetical protein
VPCVLNEMLSGPDLGAGYLHQLTFAEKDGMGTFTYHCQVGGQDAGAPAHGPLDPLGFDRAEGMCQFGGRECWHRSFDLPRSASGSVRRAYNRFRFTLAPLLEQISGNRPRPVEATLRALIDLLAPKLLAERIEWQIGGSASAWLQGAKLAPGDIDLGSTRAGVERIGELLEEYLTEPVARTEWGMVGMVEGGRAFVGTLVEGMRVEWAAARDVASARGSRREWANQMPPGGRLRIEWEGRVVPVSAIEFSLVRSAEQGRSDRLAELSSAALARGVDTALLVALLADHTVRPEFSAHLRPLLGS